jgi:putative ABC transport system ATP-binding protein
MLEAEGLIVDRNGGTRVLDGIGLRLAPGELVALEGPSGSGKSTLLWALARFLPVSGGVLRLNGTDAGATDVRAWRRAVSLVLQTPSLVPGTVGENVRLPWTLSVRAGEDGAPDDARLRRELDGLGLDEIALDRDAGELSVGQAARVALLRSLLAGPEVLLLDEPDASLDDEAAERVRARLERFTAEGGAILVVRHHRKDDPADRRVRLERGFLVEVGA